MFFFFWIRVKEVLQKLAGGFKRIDPLTQAMRCGRCLSVSWNLAGDEMWDLSKATSIPFRALFKNGCVTWKGAEESGQGACCCVCARLNQESDVGLFHFSGEGFVIKSRLHTAVIYSLVLEPFRSTYIITQLNQEFWTRERTYLFNKSIASGSIPFCNCCSCLATSSWVKPMRYPQTLLSFGFGMK